MLPCVAEVSSVGCARLILSATLRRCRTRGFRKYRWTEDEAQLAAGDQAISFEEHIKPLFRETDRESMEFAFDLWSHEEVAENSGAILERLRDGTMPCDEPWPEEQIQRFQSWVDSGTPA
jgi:hypothetical protein